jgi:group I intron endonuclease
VTNKFYVYSLIDPRTRKPFYVGRGQGDRSKDHLRRAQNGKHRNKKVQNTINELRNLGESHSVEILFSSDAKEDCFEKEMFYIAFYGRENLCNLTDGGNGANGAVRSEETRAKMALSKTGAGNPNFGKPAHNKGKPFSEESRRRMSAAMKGRKPHNFSKPMSEESKAKQSASMKGRRPHNFGKATSMEARAKLSAAHTGKIIPKETRHKMSVAHKSWWAAKKGNGNGVA